MARSGVSLRDRGISEAKRVRAPRPISGKKEEGRGRIFTLRDIINVIEFASIITSGFLFLAIIMIYNSASELFTVSRFIEFASSMMAVTLIFILLGTIVLLFKLKEIFTLEWQPALFYGIGSFLILLIPARIPLGIFPSSPLWSSIDIFFMICGTVFLVISAIIYIIRRRYFLMWYLGLIAFLFVSTHEIFRFVSWTGNFGIFDLTLATLSLILIFFGFSFYILRVVSDFILIKNLQKINDLINRAQAERRDGKRDDAIIHLKEAIRLYPWNFVAWNNLGNVYMDMEDERRAEKCYRRSLFINPNYEFSLNNLGVLRRRQARFREAIKLLEKAVNMRPDYEAARRNLELARRGVKE